MTDPMPIITAIVPVYKPNQEYLKTAIQSVYAQTFQQWELILVEDACPDHSTKALLQQINIDSPQLRAFRLNENRGVSFARNFGAHMARGRYVCFLDQDDFLQPEFMETTFSVLQQYPQIDVIRVTPEIPIPVDPLRFDALTNSLMTTALIPKELLLKTGGWPIDPIFYETPYAGEDICLKHCIEVGFTLKTITAPLYFHRCGHGNHTDRFLERSKVVDGKVIMTQGAEWDRKLATFIAKKCQQVAEHLKSESVAPWKPFEPDVSYQEISSQSSS